MPWLPWKGSGRRSSGTGARKQAGYIRPEELARALEAGAVVVDVRTGPEWRVGHIRGARHIPLQRLRSKLDELPSDRPIVFACRTGHRSAPAAALASRHGLDALDLRGGVGAWARMGGELEDAHGRPGRLL